MIKMIVKNKSISISDFSVEEGIVNVHGFLIHEGIANRQKFLKKELEKAADSFVGKPIMKEHVSAVDEVVGKITDTRVEFDDEAGAYGLAYDGEIGAEHSQLINNIRRGFVSSVSVRIGYDKRPTHYCNICGKPVGECKHNFDDDDFAPVPTDFEGKHLAIVTQPADKAASISMDFSDDGVFEEVEEILNRRTEKMSDFEEKYTNLVEEFSDFKMSTKEEIAKLEEDFKEQKVALEAETAKKVEEIVALKSDFDALTAENEELAAKVKTYEEEFSAIKEEKINGLRQKVIDLNKEVYGNLTEEQINSFEEETLNTYIDLFTHQKENMPQIKENFKADDKYDDDFQEGDVDPVSSLLGKIQ